MRQRVYALVYQNGIANVFHMVDGKDPRRVTQHAFSVCESFCAGLIESGHKVELYHCDILGDCAREDWRHGKGEVFGDRKHPPKGAVERIKIL